MQSVIVNQHCNQPHALMVSTAMENRNETEELKLNTKRQPVDLKVLDDLVFQEVTADTISSVAILGKRIVRQYASEFILPDDTRVAVSRYEATKPSEDHEEVTLSLSIALRLNEQQLAKATAIADRQDDQGTDSGAVTSMSGTSSDEMFTDTSLGMDREHYYGAKYDWENPEISHNSSLTLVRSYGNRASVDLPNPDWSACNTDIVNICATTGQQI
ncbi:hypothetical protein CRM22_005619 [Opisthorchis felineus]|uniref:Uncharacterized protein n=1 Tax=Opisthorchis felineus TaxID=147828 RepID=A0A4S2LXI8_OPIFE|nr:hypothetical protein CRM22_005619 [Opisthorchis felineus]